MSKPTTDELTVEQALRELREMFPLQHDKQWRDFEIRARIYQSHWPPFGIVSFAIDGTGRRWRDQWWEGKSLHDCMAQVRAWRESNG